VRWKNWKRPKTRRRNLRGLSIPERSAREWASSQKGYWRIAGSYVLSRALPNAYCAELGPWDFNDNYRRFRAEHTAGCGTARVRWYGRGPGQPGPYPITVMHRGRSATLKHHDG
jgi:hypothetical protein